ncbi:MAG: YgcG family protein [Gammaproteobacteria bacterium]|nr:YgcG family protein [Gammaproteobacteria bacterium]
MPKLWPALLLWLVATAAVAEVAVPPLTARVTDLTGTLTAEQKSNIEQTLQAFEAKKGSQIAVLIVPTTAPEAVEQYSLRVAEQWKLGRKGVDDGALLLVAKNDRAMRIEVGYGLEGALPDAIAKRIIAETITPYFKSGDFYGGIQAGVAAMIKVIEGEPLPTPSVTTETTASSIEQLFPLAFLLAFFVAPALRAMIGRLPAALTAGAIAGVIVWFVIGSLLTAVLLAILMAFLALFAGINTGRGGWGGGLGRSGGFGGGGFRGGGGGFGGGGASGRW